MAFKESTQRVYAVSATITNDLDEKIREWVRAEDEVRRGLEPLWTVVPIIVSADPTDDSSVQAISEANARGIWVLGEEVLSGLTEDPPDLSDLEKLLSS